MKAEATKNSDVIVIGGGIAGAAAAAELALRSCRVLLVERFELGHRRGSSHGDGRIVRYSYPEPVYLEMALLAFDAWAELERRSGEKLIERTGDWECGPAESAELAGLESNFQRSGIAYQRLSTAQSERRFPHFRLPPGSEAIYQPDGGVVRAGRAVAALWRLARTAGAEIVTGDPVVAVEPDDSRVLIRTANGRSWRGGALIVAAGGWSRGLLGELGLELPLRVTQELVAYFAPPAGGPSHRVGAMPTMIDYHTDPPFYALPQIDVAGIKVGWHRSGPVIDPDHPVEHDARLLRRIRAYLARRMPQLDAPPIERMSCLYTNTPDRHFILDRHPEWPQVAIGAGFSGHGFKFGPVIGRVLATLALGERPPIDLGLFRLERFARTQELVACRGA